MKDLKSLVKKYWYSAALLLLFLIAVFLRVYRLESLPDVLHIDEAGLGYNAWCLAHYGTDRYLNVRPFYPQNFYGGQSPLYTYLLALLIRTVGQGNLSLTLLKIPAVLASLLLFFVGTKSIRLVFDDQKWSIAAAFLLAVCPYYIMSARFALDCNLMLCCSAVALLFLIRFTQTKTLRNLILSGVFFGITMYSYALSYFLIPIFLICISLYLLYTKEISFRRVLLWAACVCITALPVILFVCSLLFHWETIHFLGLTISPIASERMSDVGVTSFWENIKDIIKITLTCGSYRLDAVPKFYTLYPLSIPFIVLGFIGAVYSFLVSLYKRTFQADSIYLLFFLSGLITIGLSGSGYVYRANSFFICYLFFLIKGLFLCCRFLSSYHTGFMLLLSAGYLLWCISFCSFYFRVYTMTDVCPNYLYSISFRECVDDVNLNLDYADLYVDLVNMKEFFFFYYPASPYDTQDEETFTDGIHTYHFSPTIPRRSVLLPSMWYTKRTMNSCRICQSPDWLTRPGNTRIIMLFILSNRAFLFLRTQCHSITYRQDHRLQFRMMFQFIQIFPHPCMNGPVPSGYGKTGFYDITVL